MRALFSISIFIIAVFSVANTTIINIPDDYPSIQHGIDASTDGDTVLVQPGIYIENINFNGRNIVVGSLFLTTEDTTYISTTIIDGNYLARVITFENEENNSAVITGFTIQNGRGGISCAVNTNPTISGNIITNNHSEGHGGGVFCQGSTPHIINNIIYDNSAGLEGGGIGCYYVDPIIINNKIFNNTASDGGGISCYVSDSVVIVDNEILNNIAICGGGIWLLDIENSATVNYNIISDNICYSEGGGIWVQEFNTSFRNNTITGNIAGGYGGGFYSILSSEIINTIVWDNAAGIEGDGIYSTEPIAITYCDVQDTLWPGYGNISEDPLFCDPQNWDFQLAENSPCAGTGQNGENIGALGIGCEATEVEGLVPLPGRVILMQNHPNPFNSSTIIRYELPHQSQVSIEVYDILGRRVRTLQDGLQQAGYHQVLWDAKEISSGVYFYKLQAGDYTKSKKMMLIK